jgi:hypothetical protein
MPTTTLTPTRTMPVYTIGTEFEHVGLTPSQVCDVLRDVVPVRNVGGYAHTTGAHGAWEAKTDSSLSDGYVGRTCELVSPVLNSDNLTDVRRVLSALTSAGGRVNASCGFHVHVGVAHLTDAQRAQIVRVWAAVESCLHWLVAPSRRNGTWSRNVDVDRAVDAIGRGAYRDTYRGSSLNLVPFTRIGTFEVRLHQGTLNARKAQTWIELITALFTVAAMGETVDGGDGSVDACAAMLADLTARGFLADRSGTYLTARAREFAGE